MSQAKCKITGCNRAKAQRGMCLMCYSRAKKKVDAGETTWEKLTAAGLCDEKTDPFDSAYEQAFGGTDAETTTRDNQ